MPHKDAACYRADTKVWHAHVHVPQPAPGGPGQEPETEQPWTVPTPDGPPPRIDEPAPEAWTPIREPGQIRPPRLAWVWH